MNARTLIEKLKTLDPEAPVWFYATRGSIERVNIAVADDDGDIALSGSLAAVQRDNSGLR